MCAYERVRPKGMMCVVIQKETIDPMVGMHRENFRKEIGHELSFKE